MGLARIDTADLPAHQRFDFWRSLHAGLDLSLTDPAAHDGYDAELRMWTTQDGVLLGHSISANTRCRFGRGWADHFVFSFTLGGEVRLRAGHDEAVVLDRDSGLVVMDASQAATTDVGAVGHDHLYLTVPRALAIGAVGGDPLQRRGGVVRLDDMPLGPVLRAHLEQLRRHGDRLSRVEMDAGVAAATQLAIGCLRQLHADRPDEALRSDVVLIMAARGIAERHSADRDLSAAAIAARLGCSRAHLYRVFARQGLTVGEMVRGVRLERAKAVIAARRDGAIEDAAAMSGYRSAAAFSRAFRQSYGMSPRAWRADVLRRSDQ
ncbi:helix-turn-helix transcriptional regulator [Sphingomonas flavalba]|uniref:helix-turn-helix transcriptional regulator n=1 Tax=Sphingomonas flavalba TaxID=2559804 RepID=UPI00109DFE14|nr:AraC family transcriptional regulator [Sphingomonas flavalba]